MLKRQITIRIEDETIEYFKSLAAESGIPYQNLINMFFVTAHLLEKSLLLSGNSNLLF